MIRIAEEDRNEISQCFFWLSLAHASLGQSMSAIGMARIHAVQGNMEMTGAEEIVTELDGITARLGESINRMGGAFYGRDEAV